MKIDDTNPLIYFELKYCNECLQMTNWGKLKQNNKLKCMKCFCKEQSKIQGEKIAKRIDAEIIDKIVRGEL